MPRTATRPLEDLESLPEASLSIIDDVGRAGVPSWIQQSSGAMPGGNAFRSSAVSGPDRPPVEPTTRR